MAARKRAVETLYDKPLPSKGKQEVCNKSLISLWLHFGLAFQMNLSTYAFLFSEIVQYSHGRVTSLSQLHEKYVSWLITTHFLGRIRCMLDNRYTAAVTCTV